MERMPGIRAVEPVISVAAAKDQIGRLELCQFILDRSQRQETESRQLTRVEFLPAIRKQQPQHFGPHRREQSMEQRLFHSLSAYLNALSIQVYSRLAEQNHFPTSASQAWRRRWCDHKAVAWRTGDAGGDGGTTKLSPGAVVMPAATER
jgi:hypothetical protein